MPYTQDGRADAPQLDGGFVHCMLCIREWEAGKAPGESPMTYARLNVVFDQKRLQVWCVRHDKNVVAFTFDESYEFKFGEDVLGILTGYLRDMPDPPPNPEAMKIAKHLAEELELRGLELRVRDSMGNQT